MIPRHSMQFCLNMTLQTHGRGNNFFTQSIDYVKRKKEHNFLVSPNVKAFPVRNHQFNRGYTCLLICCQIWCYIQRSLPRSRTHYLYIHDGYRWIDCATKRTKSHSWWIWVNKHDDSHRLILKPSLQVSEAKPLLNHRRKELDSDSTGQLRKERNPAHFAPTACKESFYWSFLVQSNAFPPRNLFSKHLSYLT